MFYARKIKQTNKQKNKTLSGLYTLRQTVAYWKLKQLHTKGPFILNAKDRDGRSLLSILCINFVVGDLTVMGFVGAV